ncbi:MAG: T9SS type A sorting domain-containing protein [Bacteroidota bacterium]
MKKALLSLAAITMIVGSAFAQYYYIPDNGQNPGGLSTDSEYPEGGGMATGWTRQITGPAATPIWAPTVAFPSGFIFNFNGNDYQAVKIASSGVVTFTLATGATVPAYGARALPASDVPDNSICILGLSSLADNDHVHTKTFGTAPNRQFWIHFSSYSYGTTASSGSLFTYWSIVLEETTNRIYIVDQRTGGYTDAQKVVSIGVQINSTTAYTVDGSPNVKSLATADATPTDNHFYEFITGTQPNVDIKASNMLVESNLALPQAPFDIAARFRNIGKDAIVSGTFNYSVNGGTAVSNPLSSLNVAKFAYTNATSTTKWNPTAAGTYVIKAWISSPNGGADGASANDTAVLSVKVWENFVVRKSLFEVFTSSTCPPCKPGNEVLQGVLDNNPGQFAVIKYQYNFPGTGDPYYTLETAVRGNYYGGINSVPRMQIDGQWNNNPNGFTQTIFDQYQSKPAFVEIKPTQVVNAATKSIDITAKVKPLVSLPGNFTLRMAVEERQTTQNVKNNGETEFNWVMKKMVPDPVGLLLNLNNANVEQTFNQSFTFEGNFRLPASAVNTSGQYIGIDLATEHSVEQFDDLITVVFVQDDATKEVLQSEWSSTGIYSSAKEVSMSDLGATIYPNPAKSNFNIKLQEMQSGSVAIYDLTGKRVLSTELNGLETEVNCNTLQNGLYVVEITVDGKTQVQKLNIAR